MVELHVTEAIRGVLKEAKDSHVLNQELCVKASEACAGELVQWKLLKKIVNELNSHAASSTQGQGRTLMLHQLCSDSSLKLSSPEPRKRSPELLARLAKLQDNLDNAAYDAMVADITVNEREADMMREPGPLPTARLQNAFGVHVVVTMGTFFALCYYGSKEYLGADELVAGLLGVVGLAFGMFLETMLLIIRSNKPEPMEERYPELFDEKLWKKGGAMNPISKKTQSRESTTPSSEGSGKGGQGAGSKKKKTL